MALVHTPIKCSLLMLIQLFLCTFSHKRKYSSTTTEVLAPNETLQLTDENGVTGILELKDGEAFLKAATDPDRSKLRKVAVS